MQANTQPRRAAVRAAFPHTIPVLTGFLFLGAAYGILMNSKGFAFYWSILMSAATFAGSMQFVAINLLTSAFNPLAAFFLTLMVNARHLFYGVSMLEQYEKTGWKKWYLIFGLCDETFSIVCSAKIPENIDQNWFYFFVTLLNQSYWVLGTALGALLGALFSFPTTGIDFVMTALFLVILINQWREQSNPLPALIGVLGSIVCLLLFGPDRFLPPAMGLILLLFTLLKKPMEQKGEKV